MAWLFFATSAVREMPLFYPGLHWPFQTLHEAHEYLFTNVGFQGPGFETLGLETPSTTEQCNHRA